MLSPQVYLPAREGSLQPELLAATLEELAARTGVDVLSCNVTRAP
jgi:hypothetical protein